MPFTHFEVEFTKEGRIFDPSQKNRLLDALSGFTDLIVISHGWNNNINDARDLYNRFFSSVDQVLGAGQFPTLRDRNFGVARVFWPSKKFEAADLIPAGGAAALGDSETARKNEIALLSVLEELKRDPERLGGSDLDPKRAAAVEKAKSQIPNLKTSEEARREYIEALRSIMDPSEAHPDDGSQQFFDRTPEEIFQEMDEKVSAPAPPAPRGAADFQGGAAGFGDLIAGAEAAARRIANYTTYYQMKERSGIVGRDGLGPLLREAKSRQPDLHMHLVGHSFGGRLVTAAGFGLAHETPNVSMSLLQAAYSHNGISHLFDGSHDGFFRKLVTDKRISGPIVITHTRNDEAVGIAYPLASRLAHQKAAALGDENDPYGGMGRNGAQHTPEVDQQTQIMKQVGQPYPFIAGTVYNLKADEFIKSHGDVTGFQVAYAFLAAVATLAASS